MLHSRRIAAVCSLLLAHAAAAQSLDAAKAKPDEKLPILWYNARALGVEGKGWAETKALYDRLPAKAEKTRPPAGLGAEPALRRDLRPFRQRRDRACTRAGR